MIHIDTTIGRLGNRIISIMNALHLGIYLQMNIYHIMPINVETPFPRFITITDNSDNIVKYKHDFYFVDKFLKTYPLLNKDIFYKNDKLVLDKLKEVINLPSALKIYDDNDELIIPSTDVKIRPYCPIITNKLFSKKLHNYFQREFLQFYSN